MRIPDSLAEKLLTSGGNTSEDELKSLHNQSLSEKRPLQDIIVENDLLSEEDFTKLYATDIEVPFTSLAVSEINHDNLKLLSEKVARQYKAVVFNKTEDGYLSLAMAEPTNKNSVGYLRKLLGDNIKIYVASDSAISLALDQYRGNISSELATVMPSSDGYHENIELIQEDVGDDSATAHSLNIIIEDAVLNNASDIHIEPRGDVVAIRYRVDGLLNEVNKLPSKILISLVKRVKSLSGLKQEEHELSQSGQFRISVKDHSYILGVSTLPVLDGEKIVIHITSESSSPLGIEELGLWGKALEDLNHDITQHHGMILFCGPDGSGKSTSLFSLLSSINSPHINISTIEDPIKYVIPGANQVQVNMGSGMTYAKGLKALIEQDANVIMVGDIKDSETANLAAEASTNGRMIFGSIKTKSASTGIYRLLEMGVEPFLVCSNIRSSIAQRLVRRLCLNCRQVITPDESTLGLVAKSFSLDKIGGYKGLNGIEKLALSKGLGVKQGVVDLSSSEVGINRLYKASEEGCESCNYKGFKGRVGIFEVLEINEEVQKLISAKASTNEIEAKAFVGGNLPMSIDGLIKSLRGLTTLEEVGKVLAT
jgi:type II secretory ATPase GspE/PulE/Tfp pilus assembly ATPase PilB-like protein